MRATKKPWGKEYLLFQNADVAIWHLFIDPGQETSFHSHPNKKTGLLVLDGGAKVSFLSDDQKLFAGDKTMIRHGVFHSTKNMTQYPLELLEIETPVDKEDIVRLQDKYGRAGTPYERDEVLDIEPLDIFNGPVRAGSCIIEYRNLSSTNLSDYLFCMITQGEIVFQNFQVSAPGDILSVETFNKMLNSFNLRNDIEGIFIKSCL